MTSQPLRDRLERFGIRPKRRFGQNFLHERSALDRITAAVAEESPDGIIEIGPGPGTLTERLADLGVPLVAVEKDTELVELLGHELRAHPHVRVRAGDILETDLGSLFTGSRPTVVGNIPYNISTPILLALLRAREQLGAAILMVQAELGERLRASVGSRAAGSLTVLLHQLADVERVLGLAPGAFFPPPKVRSEVLRIRWLDQGREPVADLRLFEKIVRAGFGQRRKTLRNALKVLGEKVEWCEERARAVDVNLDRRAETLELAEWRALANEWGRAASLPT
ncbi:MAG: 16S rRNA (adenine(1518)-N(6)/adenine(1519)-N(6))-dimethyltransferase RsmA [Myxococcota bacterium]